MRLYVSDIAANTVQALSLLEGQLPDWDGSGEENAQQRRHRRSSVWGVSGDKTPSDTFNTLSPADTPRSLPYDDENNSKYI
ncbi:hypothetical protein SK128_020217 [Halocaridina rubra]|uniref:Uncharacterized protein n=1 Tax=Halocaridina rubra TaxID=373956 RepID=A0AAN8XIU7_HALRR